MAACYFFIGINLLKIDTLRSLIGPYIFLEITHSQRKVCLITYSGKIACIVLTSKGYIDKLALLLYKSILNGLICFNNFETYP